jgi:prepilin-type N-terminal cleavage/methylation domain-containing protein
MRHRSDVRYATQRGFTLVELTVVMAVLGVLTVTALTLYANLQGRARVAKAQADLKGLQWALVAFGAHCGDVPNTATTFSDLTPLALAAAPDTCANALTGTLAGLGQQVADANNVPAGPFYTAGATLAPATGWTYTYTRMGPGQFILTASHPSDVTSPITVP